MSSFIKAVDFGLKAQLFVEFMDIMDMESISNNILFYPYAIAMREHAERMGQTGVEFVNYWRTGINTDWSRNLTPAARRGFYLPYQEEGKEPQTIHVRSVPVMLNYDVWFWSLDKDKLNQIAERYLFWQHTNPNLNMLYLDKYPLEFDLHLSGLDDQSTMEQKYEKGVYHVYHTQIGMEGWIFLSDEPTSNIIKNIRITCYNKDNIAEYEEIISEGDNQNTELAESLKLFRTTITSENEEI